LIITHNCAAGRWVSGLGLLKAFCHSPAWLPREESQSV
jgi:hypothetical protein